MRHTNNEGFSLVEILLAVTIFGMTVTAVIGAIVYGNASNAGDGYRNQAVQLADEGLQAVRNIRDAAFTNLVDGTYGVSLTGGVMTLSGTSDTSGIFTRTVTVASNGVKRKTITANVTWNDSTGSTHNYNVQTQLSNWRAAFKSWVNATQSGLLDLAGTTDGYSVDTIGNYAYIIKNASGSTNFFIVNISTPTAPTLVGSMTLAGVPNDVRVSGNYAYVASSNDTTELQVVSIATPSAPTLTTSYDASGTADGKSIYINGNTLYLARAANSGTAELVSLNITTPSAPTLLGSYGNNLTMNDVFMSGNYLYLATSGGTVLVINATSPASLSLASTYTPAGTGAVSAVSLYGSTLLIGKTSTFSTAAIGTGGALTASGSVATSGTGTINSIDRDPSTPYAFLGTTATAAEFQIVSLATITTPTIAKIVDVSGTTSTVYGVAYNPTLDVVVGASALDTGETLVFGKN